MNVSESELLQCLNNSFLYNTHIFGWLKTCDDFSFAVDEEFCEIPFDVCLIAKLLVIEIGELA